jgi:hypothetical protein
MRTSTRLHSDIKKFLAEREPALVMMASMEVE